MFVFQMTFLMGLTGVIGSSISSNFLDKYGRKVQLLVALSAYTVVQIIMVMFNEFKNYLDVDKDINSEHEFK